MGYSAPGLDLSGVIRGGFLSLCWVWWLRFPVLLKVPASEYFLIGIWEDKLMHKRWLTGEEFDVAARTNSDAIRGGIEYRRRSPCRLGQPWRGLATELGRCPSDGRAAENVVIPAPNTAARQTLPYL